MDLIESYVKEIEQELKIDEFNVKEVAMRLPARKHFWVAKLIFHKRMLLNLEEEKGRFKEDVSREVTKASPVKLSTSTILSAVDMSEKIKEINKKIADEKLIIEFLEKTEKVLSSASFDISNIVKINQLEQL
jgi:hypothetical protein